MKCAIHTDRDAIGACSSCGRPVCPECKVAIGGRDYCNTCLQTRLKTGAWPGQPPISSNNSGQGSGTPIPAEIRGWSWGGFLLTWIWGIGNNVWIAFISLLGFIPGVGLIIELVMRIILGIKGNEWAWQRKKWESVEHFQKIQRTWMWWGVGLIVAYVIFAVAMGVLLYALYQIGNSLGLDNNIWGNMLW